MRIVIDMQGAQAENRNRGIGRCVLAFAKAMICQRGEHEIILVLNAAFSDTIESIRASFLGLLPQENIRVWRTPRPTAQIEPDNQFRRGVAELTFESFLASLRPDFIYLQSLFEGLVDDAVVSVHRLQNVAPVAVTLYDLIPFINPSPYLENPAVRLWYQEKIENLRKADLLLAISESSRQEAIEHLNFPAKRCVTTHIDADSQFGEIRISDEDEMILRGRYGLLRPFVMYTGGVDHRKNIEGLIRSYAKLPIDLRGNHQLAIVCAVDNFARDRLKGLAIEQGLGFDELILTGFVPDEDLVALYNLCKLFVFPSWHEGFGLPVLEAMRCGAPVVGADASSIPEVVGWAEALFDPHCDEAIASAIKRGLSDESFRQALSSRGREQAKNFSWEEAACRALAAMEQFNHANPIGRHKRDALNAPIKPKLAYISPLPPARSGIADYSADLLPALAEYYDIDVIVEQSSAVTDPWALTNCSLRTVQWLIDHAKEYQRTLYHFGNSEFHAHMFGLLNRLPGVVVLHDFFLSGIQAHRDVHGWTPNVWAQTLHRSHGYSAVADRFSASDTAEVVWRYPASLPVLQRALGVIVHGEYSRRLARRWYGSGAGADWSVVPLLRAPVMNGDRAAARRKLGLSDSAILVCSFGMLGATKLNHRLLQAWLNSPLSRDKNAHLVFVGENPGGHYGDGLLHAIREGYTARRVTITGWTEMEVFHRYLAAADIGVQLRTLTRGETSAAVLDCMNYGLATIVNAHGSMGDLDPESVWMLPDEFDDSDLVAALTVLAENNERRHALGAKARAVVHELHSPASCAEMYFDAIEGAYRRAHSGLSGVVNDLPWELAGEGDIAEASSCLSANIAPAPRRKQLLVDVSELVNRDVGSGIQRVVRAILREWLINPPHDFQVEPVYATPNIVGYRYARQFTCRFLSISQEWAADEIVECWSGDVFVGLDLQPQVIPTQRGVFEEWRDRGVAVWFVVYDLLPILLPECFPSGAKGGHEYWLEIATSFDGVVCISHAVAEDARSWLSTRTSRRMRPLQIKWFHLGADVNASVPTQGMLADSDKTLGAIRALPSFLMVGTIEPRKGHAPVLDAFEELWACGVQANLVIVGKQGWMVETLIERLRLSPEAGKRLFWLSGITDEYLEKIYAASKCLVAASYAEGFGLPLIEAAQHGLPIFARDIQVFREVAGENAFYFQSDEPVTLSSAIQKWLALNAEGLHPRSSEIPWITWENSAKSLIDQICGIGN